LALACTSASAGAQALASLHVRAFTLSLDKTTVRVGETFHLTIDARTAERLAQLDNVTLPDLSGFDDLADERRCSATPQGTDCIEVMTLQPAEAGIKTLGPATLEAIDARTRVPSRFATNTRVLTVLGPPPLASAAARLAGIVPGALRALATVALFIFAVAAVRWLRRRAPMPPLPGAGEAVEAPPPFDPAAHFRASLTALAAEPTRARVVNVRDVLRQRASAGERETLGDLTARGALDPDGDLYAALHAIERAAFCEVHALPGAVRDALPALERLAGGAEPVARS
jgi:hypothetical protein